MIERVSGFNVEYTASPLVCFFPAEHAKSMMPDILTTILSLGESHGPLFYDTGDSGFFTEEALGIAALWSYGTGVVIVTGWSLSYRLLGNISPDMGSPTGSPAYMG
uniref:Uncharacterized protein n=1 Tax=Equus asinus TaxID=9793 RepID=A0A9L0ILV3_EQUAS